MPIWWDRERSGEETLRHALAYIHSHYGATEAARILFNLIKEIE